MENYSMAIGPVTKERAAELIIKVMIERVRIFSMCWNMTQITS